MSAGVAIDQPTPHQIQFLLWQDSAEVPRFMLFVLVIAVAFFLLMPQARSSPMPLLGLVGAAVGWCAVAGSAREATSLTMRLGPFVYSAFRCWDVSRNFSQLKR